SHRQKRYRRVPVEGAEPPRLDLPLAGEARAEPRYEDDEKPRDEHLRRVERGLRESDANAGLADLLRACAVAREEGLLPADPAQDTQSRSRVGAERGQLADLFTLLSLTRLEGLYHEHHQQDERG